MITTGLGSMERVLPFSGTTPFAFSNPIFVDVDGDGKYNAPNARPLP